MRKAYVLGYLLFLLLLASCTQEEGPRAGTPEHTTISSQLSLELWKGIASPPDLDLVDASQRLKGASQTSAQAIPQLPEPQLGSAEEFWVTNLEPVSRFKINAVLRHVTPHAFWYVDSSISVNDDSIQASAQEFERVIYPTLINTFGPFQDGGPPVLTVLNTSFRGAAGYFSSRDMYPVSVHPFSNQRPILYIHARALSPGTRNYNSVVSHEFQHYLHWLADPDEESWINEGMSVWTEELAGFKSGMDRALAQDADIQLTGWSSEPSTSGPHYAAAYLFMRYLAQRYGGASSMGALMKESADSIESVDDFLSKAGYKERFLDVFAQWVAANFLDPKPNTIGRYDDASIKVRPTAVLKAGEPVSSTVHQFGAKYYDITDIRPEGVIHFAGKPDNRIIGNQAKSGSYQWWSNRGDFIDSTMTREFDLTSVSAATLSFNLWYDAEDKWDYGYIEVSTDGGKTWKILQGLHTTTDNPIGNAFGPGYTGISGGGSSPIWIEERIDLTPYAGGKILVRFEYITDEAVNNTGIAIDDIRVPEIGYSTDTENGEDGWIGNGFVRTDNHLPQQYLVQAILFYRGGDVRVVPIQLDQSQEGSLPLSALGDGLARVVMIVSGVAPVTTETAQFTLSVS